MNMHLGSQRKAADSILAQDESPLSPDARIARSSGSAMLPIPVDEEPNIAEATYSPAFNRRTVMNMMVTTALAGTAITPTSASSIDPNRYSTVIEEAATVSELISPTVDWESLELEIGGRRARFEFVLDEVITAESAFKKWEKRNPFPAPEYSSIGERTRDHAAQQSRESEWTVRYQNALKQCGVGALKIERNRCQHNFDEVRHEIAHVKCGTLADIKAKARLAYHHDYLGGPISLSVVSDLVKNF